VLVFVPTSSARKSGQKIDDEMINGHLRLAKVTFRHTQKRESRGK